MRDRAEDNLYVMQSRCPHCDAEMYALAVLPFAAGETPCGECGQTSRPMTEQEWLSALREVRRKDA